MKDRAHFSPADEMTCMSDCWEQPGALPFHKRLMDTGEAIILF